ncbi:MAG: hypothetical protein ACSHXL_00945 [Bacteroidota bacterium]
MAYGGAVNLAPIKSIVGLSQPSKEPNWNGIIRVYNCLTFLLISIVLVIFTINTIIGYISLKEICSKIANVEARGIWYSFIVMRLGDFINNASAAPNVAMRGLNHVALMNRWSVIFQIASVIGGYITLILGGSMLSLVIVMQSLALLGVIRSYYLSSIVNEGILWRSWKPRWDKEIFLWAKEPLWKGFIAEFSKNGVLQISAIIFTFYSSTAGIASYLFSLNIARSIQHISMSPFTSQLPRFTKLLAGGFKGKLVSEFKIRVIIAQLLLVLGFITIAIIGPLLIEIIGSENKLITMFQWFALGGIFLYERFNTYFLAICASGNNMLLIFNQLTAGIFVIILTFLLVPRYGVEGILLAMFLPVLVITNIKPYLAFHKFLLK